MRGFHLNTTLLFILLITASAVLAQQAGVSQGFVENKGQLHDQDGRPNPQVIAKFSGGDIDVLFYSGGFAYQLHKASDGQPCIANQFHRVDISFEGKNPGTRVEFIGKSKDYDNFIYPGENGPVEIYDVHSYEEILYHDIYDGVDVQFLLDKKSGSACPVKFNFILEHAYLLPSIKLKYEGADFSDDVIRNTMPASQLKIKTSIGDIVESVPYSYYELPYSYLMRERTEIATDIGYVVGADGVVSFSFMSEKLALSDKKLVIDPTPSVSWATYYGGNGVDHGITTELDGFGGLYLGGITMSSSNVATAGSHQATYGGSPFYDMFISKFDLNGLRLWSTYIGGTNDDQVYDLAADATANIYFVGSSASLASIATAGSYQSTGAGASDAVIGKLNSSGTLTWCTYFGGSLNDVGRGVAVKGTNVTIVGQTSSTSGIASGTPYQLTYGGGASDGFITQFNTSGSLLWSTYLGGAGTDLGVSVVNDPLGNPFITGYSNSTSGISTAGVYQPANAGANDAVIASFTNTGVMQWSTYYGGSLNEIVSAISMDALGDLLISGQTNSSSGIASPGANDVVLGGPSDSYLAKFTSTGARTWSTYLGGNIVDYSFFSCFDAAGYIYVGGYTNSTSALATTGAAQTTFSGGSADAFIAQFTGGGVIQWATYMGGSGDDYARSMAVDVVGGAFVAGLTTSASSIATAGSYQPGLSVASVADAFLLKYENFMLLPISIMQFEATGLYDEHQVRCGWHSASENDCHSYVLEKSHDGISWHAFSECSCGLSEYESDYTVFDTDPMYGLSYYRLLKMNHAGELAESHIASVYFNHTDGLTLFPVPAGDEVNIVFPSEQEDMIKVCVFNIAGSLMHEESVPVVTGSNFLRMSLQGIPAGVYTLRLVRGNSEVINHIFTKS